MSADLNPVSPRSHAAVIEQSPAAEGGAPMVGGAQTPEPPYYAVIFTSLRTPEDDPGYAAMATRMEELAAEQPGFLGVESARGSDGLGITVSYWASLEAIRAWRQHAEHRLAQHSGRERWYQWYRLCVCRVETAYPFEAQC
jgi:heme-degrading monooxygenase HmoA